LYKLWGKFQQQKIEIDMLTKFFFQSLILLFVLPSIAFSQSKKSVSLLLYNGKIFSADKAGTTHQAVYV